MALLLSSALVHAQTVDVKTRVLSLQESGAIELVLPKDQMVAIGDKVEFETPLSSQATDEKPDIEWSVARSQGWRDNRRAKRKAGKNARAGLSRHHQDTGQSAHDSVFRRSKDQSG